MVTLKSALMVCERFILMILSLEIECTPVQNIVLVIRKIVVNRYCNSKRIIRKLIGRNTKLLNY